MRKRTRLLSLLLSLLMMISILPSASLSAMADPNPTATVTVGSVTASPGSTVDVPISISNNPGVLGAIISISYDEGITLVNATSGDAFSALAMTKPGQFQSPCQFTWDGLELSASDVKDGTILTLSFEVSDTVADGTTCNIRVSYEYGDFVDTDLNPVEVTFNNGSINVQSYKSGDADGNYFIIVIALFCNICYNELANRL